MSQADTATIDLEFDDTQRSIASAIDQFCGDQCTAEVVRSTAGRFPTQLWSRIQPLGVLSLGTPEGDGGAMEMVAACESLGRAVFPGPLIETFLAMQLLDADSRKALAAGTGHACVGRPPLMPWAPGASRYIEISGDRAFDCRVVGDVTPVDTLGGAVWGRLRLERSRELSNVPRALAFGEIATAAYLASAAQGLVAATSEHARTRRQFGQALGDFQAVAHPLADCEIRLTASRSLAREAAYFFDRIDPEADFDRVWARASAAQLSASAAGIASIAVCHQLFGAIGITMEGPAFHVSRRIQQMAGQSATSAAARDRVLCAFGI